MSAGEFLKTELACSRNTVNRLKHKDMGIVKNGVRITVREKLYFGDVLELALEDGEDEVNPALVPVQMPLDIIFEDEDIIALNKPAGIPTHPSMLHFDDTLANGLAAYFAASGTPFVFRAMNRLDRNTSGVIVVAKNRLASSRLSDTLKRGGVEKIYIAVTDGIPEPAAGRIESDIRRRQESIITREALPADSGAPGAQFAATEYVTVSSDAALCRSTVLVRPITGRTHQIRVHFSYIGTPLLGDDLYGRASPDFPHQALHALSLSFPYRDGNLTLTAPVPPRLAALTSLSQEEVIRALNAFRTQENAD